MGYVAFAKLPNLVTWSCIVGYVEFFREADEKVSELLAVAASPGTQGFMRPVMKMMEWSMHGVPWILTLVVLIFFVQSEKAIQLLVNLLVGKLVPQVAAWHANMPI